MALTYVMMRGKVGVINGFLVDAVQVFEGLPGQKKWVNRDILFELSAANIEFLQKTLQGNVIWSKEIKSLVEDIARKRQEQAEVSRLKSIHIPDATDFPFVRKPYAHQMKAFQISRYKKVFALLPEMGTGKTKISIDTMADLYFRGEISSVLIFAPNKVQTQWINEQIPEHLPKEIVYSGVAYQSKSKASLRKYEELLKFNVGLRVLAMNIECLQYENLFNLAVRYLKNDPNNLIIIDESVDIKTPGSVRTKNAMRLRPLSKYRRILTGAPIPKGVEDFYSQFAFLDPDILGFKSFYTFRNHFCVMGGYENKKIVAYKNLEELQAKIDGWSFRILKKDCLDLPEKIYMRQPVPLTPRQAEVYDELKTELISYLKDLMQDQGEDAPFVTAGNGGGLLIKLQQVLCGFVVDNQGNVIDLVSVEENPRIITTARLIKEIEGKVLIWARFTKDIHNLESYFERINVKFVSYHGETSDKKRDEAIDRFRNDPNCKVFIANPAAAGVGLNLAVAGDVIFYSNDFNAHRRWQAEDRTHRIGMKGSCTYVDLYTADTVDLHIIETLKHKKELSETVVDAKTLLKFLKET